MGDALWDCLSSLFSLFLLNQIVIFKNLLWMRIVFIFSLDTLDIISQNEKNVKMIDYVKKDPML